MLSFLTSTLPGGIYSIKAHKAKKKDNGFDRDILSAMDLRDEVLNRGRGK